MNSELHDTYYSLCAGAALLCVALSIGVGFRRSGMRPWNAALIAETVGWGLLGLSTSASAWPLPSILLGSLGAWALAFSVSSMYVSAAHYTGRRPRRSWIYGPPAVAALAFMLSGADAGQRLLAAHAVLAAEFSVLAWYLRPRSGDGIGTRWRWLAFGTYAMAVVTLLVASLALVLGILDKGSSLYDAAALQAWPLVNIAGTLAFLLAHRDEAEQELRRLATRDGLTGLLNRRAALDRASEQLAERRRGWRPYTVILLDLDHFKQINDSHGHPVGDRVLELFARVLRENVRPGDTVGRFGGEEFLVVLPAGIEAARAIDTRLRTALVAAAQREIGIHCNFSAGAATLLPDGGSDLQELIDHADRALYQAKHEGRARLALWQTVAPRAPEPPAATFQYAAAPRNAGAI